MDLRKSTLALDFAPPVCAIPPPASATTSPVNPSSPPPGEWPDVPSLCRGINLCVATAAWTEVHVRLDFSIAREPPYLAITSHTMGALVPVITTMLTSLIPTLILL